MSLRFVLAAAAVLVTAAPAAAQDTTQQQQQQIQREPTAEEIAFNQVAQGFRGRMDAMMAEVRAVLADPNTNGGQKIAAVDTILVTYTPEINGFADQLQTFLVARQAVATDPNEQAAIAEALQGGPSGVRSIPEQVRTGVAQAIAAAEAQANAEAQAGQTRQQSGSDSVVAGTVPPPQ